jgi:hypothetical protein
MGYTLFIGAQMRKIEIVSHQEYLTSQLEYTSKQYTVDFTPLAKEKNHIFAKYELKVVNHDTRINLHINCPNDKYLLDYLRIKIVDKTSTDKEGKIPYVMHTNYLENLTLAKSDEPYVILIEGCMPYNTTEGQLVVDMNTNQESLELQEIIGCEPVEYTDKYIPSKYGIIFKEKVLISPLEHTMISLNVKLTKGD